jgi:hypothetical protein
MLHPDAVTPRLPQRSPPALDVGGQPSSLTLADARSQVNVLRFHFAMTCSFSQREG